MATTRASLQSVHFNQSDKLARYFRYSSNSGAYGGSWEAQMERVAILGVSLKPCKRCGGARRKLKNGWEERAGLGWVVTTRKGDVPPTLYWSRWDKAAHLDLNLPVKVADRLCPDCNGRGWVEGAKSKGRITAYPTGSSIVGRGASYEQVSLEFIHVAEWLAKLIEWEEGADEPPAVESVRILQAYFASKQDRRLHVWSLTHAGHRLLRQANGQRPIAWLRKVRKEVAEDRFHRNALLVERADEETSALLEQAAEAWNTLVPSEGEQRRQSAERECGLEPLKATGS